MSLASVSIRRPVFAWMLMAAMILFGGISFQKLGVSQLPDIDFPVVNVGVAFNGASPEVIESDVVDIIENALMGTQGLRDISSTSRYGSANITIEFDLDRNIDVAMQEVQSKISSVMRQLPKGIDAPVVSKNNPEDQPIIWLALAGDVTQRELMQFARDKIINQFQLVPGVGDVFFGGYLEPNIRVWLNGEKLSAMELSIDDVINAIGREHVELPAGTLQEKSKEYTLRVVGEARSAEEFGKIAITKRGGSPIYNRILLRDISRVESGLEDIRRTSRVLGKNAVGIGVRKQRGTNAVEVAKGVKAKLTEVSNSLPKNMNIGVNFDSTKFIEESISELKFELLLSSLLTGLVCWLFLRSWSSTFNVLLAIPTSLIGACVALFFMGFTLNTFTFLGLILAVGIVVDDAIMVLENIVRYREMGHSKEQAALEGANQITLAAMATTFSIMAIFLPVAFMKGIIGKFFFQFGITISVAVGLSLIESLTLTPMRCAEFLYVPEHNDKHWVEKSMRALTRWYEKSLVFSLNHRWKVIVAATAVFIGSIFIFGSLKKEFVPAQDQSVFLVKLQTPTGSSLEYTDKVFKEAEEKISQIPEIKRYFAAIGGFSGVSQVNSGMLFITLKPIHERSRSQQQLMQVVREQLAGVKDLKAAIQDLSGGGFGAGRQFPIDFSLRGPNWETLVAESQKIITNMKADKRFLDVDTNYQEGVPEVQIIPDRERALNRGVSVDDIGKAVQFLVGGDKISRFTENGRRIDVRIRLDDNFRAAPNDILKLYVRNNRGELVRLGDVATLKVISSLVSITRQQRERSISIFSNVAPNASQADLLKVVEAFQKDLPDGYRLVQGGASKSMAESFQSLGFALYLGLFIAYMILASQYNSFIHPFTVLLALPFSLTGAWIALKLGGQSMNIYSMIGFILLMGIVKKNSIMLVDFTNQVRDSKEIAVRDALIEACPIRLRPILMTSIAIVAAAVPSVLGLGPGSETRIPMSLAVVGGVILSTFFTLYVVPCAYSLLARLERKKKQTAAL